MQVNVERSIATKIRATAVDQRKYAVMVISQTELTQEQIDWVVLYITTGASRAQWVVREGRPYKTISLAQLESARKLYEQRNA